MDLQTQGHPCAPSDLKGGFIGEVRQTYKHSIEIYEVKILICANINSNTFLMYRLKIILWVICSWSISIPAYNLFFLADVGVKHWKKCYHHHYKRPSPI